MARGAEKEPGHRMEPVSWDIVWNAVREEMRQPKKMIRGRRRENGED